jgi:hypothetical protein
MEKPPKKEQVICTICQQKKAASAVVPAFLVRSNITDLIKPFHPDWNEQSQICKKDLSHFRALYVEKMLLEEKGELSGLDEQVISNIRNQEMVANSLGYHEHSCKNLR